MRSILALLFCAFAVTAVHATVTVPAEFSEVVNGSTIIARGRVVDLRPAWGEGRRRIDTEVTVEVLEWYRGGQEDTITFVTPGGTMGRYRQVVVGAPTFRTGDESFLFLKQTDDGRTIVFGLNQGIFRVRSDASGQLAVIRPALVLAPGEDARTLVRGDVTRRPVALPAFVAQLRAAMTRTQAAR